MCRRAMILKTSIQFRILLVFMPVMKIYKKRFQENIKYRNLQAYQPKKSSLHWIRIYFSSPTFDRVTRDEKANFVTKLSTIGGTMGLFAGFSIISGIELLYFGCKILFCFITNNWIKRRIK